MGMLVCDNGKVVDDFAGRKIDINDLAGHKLQIVNYKKETSTKHPGTYYYKIQGVWKNYAGDLELVFTTCGARQIVEVLDQNPPMNFIKTIVKVGKMVQFAEDTASDQEALQMIVQKFGITADKL